MNIDKDRHILPSRSLSSLMQTLSTRPALGTAPRQHSRDLAGAESTHRWKESSGLAWRSLEKQKLSLLISGNKVPNYGDHRINLVLIPRRHPRPLSCYELILQSS